MRATGAVHAMAEAEARGRPSQVRWRRRPGIRMIAKLPVVTDQRQGGDQEGRRRNRPARDDIRTLSILWNAAHESCARDGSNRSLFQPVEDPVKMNSLASVGLSEALRTRRFGFRKIFSVKCCTRLELFDRKFTRWLEPTVLADRNRIGHFRFGAILNSRTALQPHGAARRARQKCAFLQIPHAAVANRGGEPVVARTARATKEPAPWPRIATRC